MIFSIFTTVISLLPLIGKLGAFAVAIVAFIVGTVCCGTVTSIAYIRYRPLIAIGIIVLSLGIWGIVAWRLDEAADSFCRIVSLILLYIISLTLIMLRHTSGSVMF